MRYNRRKLNLTPEHNRLLKILYFNRRTPLDQYAHRPGEFSDLCEEFRGLAGLLVEDDDVHHYIMTERKASRWVRFGGQHRRLRSPTSDEYTPAETAALIAIYEAIGVGSDRYAHDQDLKELLADRFASEAGRRIDSNTLYAYLMSLRKAGCLPQVDGGTDPDIGFGDIGRIAS